MSFCDLARIHEFAIKISFKFEIFYHFKTGFGIIRWSKNQAFHAFKLIDFPFNIHSILMFVFGLANC